MEGEQRKNSDYEPGKWIGNKRKKKLSRESEAYKHFFYRKQRYTVVPHVFFQMMAMDEAMVLAHLLNLRTIYELTDDLDKGWFFCTSKRIESTFGLKRTPQTRIFKSLIAKKFIKTELRGIPRRRYIYVNRKRIRKAALIQFGFDPNDGSDKKVMDDIFHFSA